MIIGILFALCVCGMIIGAGIVAFNQDPEGEE